MLNVNTLSVLTVSIFFFLESIAINVKYEILNMTQAWDKEKSKSLTGIEPMTFQTLGGRSIHLATRPHGEQGHFY